MNSCIMMVSKMSNSGRLMQNTAVHLHQRLLLRAPLRLPHLRLFLAHTGGGAMR